MMLEAPAKVDHKENDQSKSDIHRKKYDTASTVFDKLDLYSLTGGIFSGMPDQKQAHCGKTEIICAERIKPKGVVVNSKSQMQNAV